MEEEDAIDWGDGALEEEEEEVIALAEDVDEEQTAFTAEPATNAAGEKRESVGQRNEEKQKAASEAEPVSSAADTERRVTQESKHASTQEKPVEQARSDPISTPLPSGWKERKARSGEMYYVNKLTGESTWDRPTEPAKEPVDRARSRLSSESRAEKGSGDQQSSAPKPPAAIGIQIKGSAKGQNQGTASQQAEEVHGSAPDIAEAATPVSLPSRRPSTDDHKRPAGPADNQPNKRRRSTSPRAEEKVNNGREDRKSQEKPAVSKKGWGRDPTIAAESAREYGGYGYASQYGGPYSNSYDIYRPERRGSGHDRGSDAPAASDRRLAERMQVRQGGNGPASRQPRSYGKVETAKNGVESMDSERKESSADWRARSARPDASVSSPAAGRDRVAERPERERERRHAGNRTPVEQSSRERRQDGRMDQAERGNTDSAGPDRRAVTSGAQQPSARWPARRAAETPNGPERMGRRDTSLEARTHGGAQGAGVSDQIQKGRDNGGKAAPAAPTAPRRESSDKVRSEPVQSSRNNGGREGVRGPRQSPPRMPTADERASRGSARNLVEQNDRWQQSRSRPDSSMSNVSKSERAPPSGPAADRQVDTLTRRERELREREEAIARRERELGLRG